MTYNKRFVPNKIHIPSLSLLNNAFKLRFYKPYIANTIFIVAHYWYTMNIGSFNEIQSLNPNLNSRLNENVMGLLKIKYKYVDQSSNNFK